jgi:protein TonB
MKLAIFAALLISVVTLRGQEIPRDGVIPPRPTKTVKAVYTSEARDARIEGTVVLDVLVREDGLVSTDVRIVRSLDQKLGLDEQAVIATRQWQFKPATRHGEPFAMHVTIEQTFKLTDR